MKSEKSAAFTLIELLVVVLIIGILAAIVVPQYQKAVLKTRFMTYMPLMRAIKEAQERYYMVNGDYTLDVPSLDISIPSECHIWSGSSRANQILCGTDWLLDNMGDGAGGNDSKSTRVLALTYCPGKNAIGAASCYTSSNLQATIYWYYDQHPTQAGQITCRNDANSQLCDTLKGLLK